MPSTADPVTLLVNSMRVTGWSDVAVTLRCEGLPNSFELSLFSKDPEGQQVVAQTDDPVSLYLGDDLLITGYIDAERQSGSPEEHTLTLTGRGRTRDLVKNSAQWPGGLISAVNILTLCQKLGKPYSIDASLADGLSAPAIIPDLALNYGESCVEIIERVAKNQRVLFYETPDGNLILSQVGKTRAAGGVIYGQNVYDWECTNDNSERYANIYCAQFSTNPVFDQTNADFNLFGMTPDKNVRWPSTLIINTEGLSKEVADAKAQWEVARRAGRATQVRATVDDWRDVEGTLWTPNTLIPCKGPGLRYNAPTINRLHPATPGPVDLCLSEVTFRYGLNSGTVANLVLMPPEAFSPEPIQLQPPAPGTTAIGAQPVPTTF